jgi:hypothetical protein
MGFEGMSSCSLTRPKPSTSSKSSFITLFFKTSAALFADPYQTELANQQSEVTNTLSNVSSQLTKRTSERIIGPRAPYPSSHSASLHHHAPPSHHARPHHTIIRARQNPNPTPHHHIPERLSHAGGLNAGRTPRRFREQVRERSGATRRSEGATRSSNGVLGKIWQAFRGSKEVGL